MYNYSLDNLYDDSFLDALTEQVHDVEFYNDTKEAMDILRGLMKAVNDNREHVQPDVLARCQMLAVRLKYILFLAISDDELLDLLKHHIAVGIQIGYIDLLELLKTRI